MRKPENQAEFFKLLSTLFYYMISGKSHIAYLADEEWNPCYKEKYGLQVSPDLVPTDSQKRPMYDCVIVKPCRGVDEILDEEGDLDGESDASDVDMDDFKLRRGSFSYSITSSTRGEFGSRAGSPMDESK
jgi:hypothetical protein